MICHNCKNPLQINTKLECEWCGELLLVNSDKIFIKSPLKGTFYRNAGPNEAPFIDVGDEFKVGKIICVIECVDLLFHEIETDINGRILEVLVEDGSIVDLGQILFVVESN